jgi:regulator of replication initiation timing
MEPLRPGALEQENAALQAENDALKKRLAALEARRAELERLEQAATAGGDHQATNLEGVPRAKGQSDRGDGN